MQWAKPRISMTHASKQLKSKLENYSCNQRFLEVMEKHKLRKSARSFDSLTRIRLPHRLYSRDWRAEIISSLQRQRAIAGAEPRSCTPRSVWCTGVISGCLEFTYDTCDVPYDSTPALMPAGLEKVSRLARIQRAFDRRCFGKTRSRPRDEFVYTCKHAKVWISYKILDCSFWWQMFRIKYVSIFERFIFILQCILDLSNLFSGIY